ncbi:type II secretion system protein GspK [Arsukibacterium ikkense]|nr:type II secretion system protein GspK [Arsukibacterium ikkense]
MKPKYTKRGVALVQVLFITTILSLMALHFTLTSRQQVAIATTLQDKVSAELQLLNWKNELLFTLLSQPATGSVGADNTVATQISQHWNFHGMAFSPADNVQIRLQDIEGLLSISIAGKDAELQQLFSYLQLPEADAVRIISELAAQQDLPSVIHRPLRAIAGRQMFLQSISELQQLPGISAEQYRTVAALTTNLQVSRFNPLNAPDALLRALLLPDIANEVIRLRNTNALTAASYSALVRIGDYENYSFVRGERLLIELEVTHGSAVAKRRFICYIRPENQFPLIWLD